MAPLGNDTEIIIASKRDTIQFQAKRIVPSRKVYCSVIARALLLKLLHI